jgi:two-component system phosphate regulon sensor histidine kinase PhoR
MNPFKSIRAKLTAWFMVLSLATIALLGFYLSRWVDDYYIAVISSDLTRESRLLGHEVTTGVRGGGSLAELSQIVGMELGRRVTVIRTDGVVLADSMHDPATMESHSGRPEVIGALAEGVGSDVRRSATLRTRMLYVATRIGPVEKPFGVARLAQSLSEVDLARGRIHQTFLVAGLVAFLLAALVGARVASSLTEPIQRMSVAAKRYAAGELGHALEVGADRGDEVGELASTMKTMAGDLQATVAELRSEKAKLQAILERTDDGLLVVSAASRVEMANPAAAARLRVAQDRLLGATVIECTLSNDLAELVEEVLRTGVPATREVLLSQDEPSYLKVYAAPLMGSGAILVLHDLTAARRIDEMRRDFVANVSHELRTPLASIRSMAETIQHHGQKDPEMVGRFSERILTEADRLTAVSEDLLDLARIEAGRRTIEKSPTQVGPIVEEVVSSFGAKATQKGVRLSVEGAGELSASVDAGAFRQILANLIDNAVNYTSPGGSVNVSAQETAGMLDVVIEDSGIGIPKEDQRRIFERFYRVDRARSRESGGTGLGLSIVKHLVEAHGGQVSVSSELGVGSTFTVRIPMEA